MTANRRYVLAGVVAALGVVTGAILLKVLGTILFALTVAYVLLPVHGWLVRRGLSEWTAGVVATFVGFSGVVTVVSPIVVTLYLRMDELLAIVRDLPTELTITAADATVTLEATEVRAWLIDQLRSLSVGLATAAPELAVKFTLFVLLLFGLLLKGDAAGRAAIAPVPHEYRDVVHALAWRARSTLYAIYVLQLATAVGTSVAAYPFFRLLGYDAALMLAMIAGILQFVPIVGPTMLVAPIALYHVALGEPVAAVAVGGLGVVLIGWLPDVVIRPRLARRSAGLPGSLYFVGFTGGLFTLGAIGVVVGPLVVAVFVEAVSLLADEVNGEDLPDLDGSPGQRVGVPDAAVDAADASSETRADEPSRASDSP